VHPQPATGLRQDRLALYDTRCGTEYGTASVDRSLTVPTGASEWLEVPKGNDSEVHRFVEY
jgi:hypothetical protein